MLCQLFPFQHEFTTPSLWESACKSEWWPFDDRTCIEMRCTACAPSIMSAAAVCNVIKGGQKISISYKCMQKVIVNVKFMKNIIFMHIELNIDKKY